MTATDNALGLKRVLAAHRRVAARKAEHAAARAVLNWLDWENFHDVDARAFLDELEARGFRVRAIPGRPR